MLISNPKYKIEIGDKGEILSLNSLGKEFVGAVLPLFQLRLRKGGETELLYSSLADKTEQITEDGNPSFKYTFGELEVVATISCGARLEFGLKIINGTDKIVEWIDYPQIAVPNDLVRKDGSGRLVYDINEGLLIEDFDFFQSFDAYKYREMEYPSEGLYGMFPAGVESQFLSYYDDAAGIYVAAEDAQRGIKGVNYAPVGDTAIKMLMRLYPAVEKGQAYEQPFNMVVDFFKGDWHDAAELYRKWFDNNLPPTLKKVRENETLPEWYTDSPLVVTYPVQGIHDMDPSGPNRLFPYNNALPYLDDIAEKTGSRIMVPLMHWEGTAPWAPPYVWPPLGGEEMFKEFGDELHKRNFIFGVYCSGISYSLHSNINDFNREEEYEKENLERFMCAPPNGGKPESKTCQMQRKSYDMCISQDYTKDVLLKEAAKMASSGLDYIQILDQNHGGTPYFCYSDKHGHPAVPGKWMVEHMTDFLVKLKDTVGEKVLLGCESAAAEAYTGYLNMSDNRFNLNYAAGKPIPLYGYVYHEYLHNFSGNSVCSLSFIDIKKSPDCHMLRVAHSYLAGDLMTLVINQDGEIVWSWGERDFSILPERQPIMDFVKSATALRRGVGKEYLVYGKMVKPCPVECETVAMYKPEIGYRNDYPAVLTTAWSAADGSRAQILASYRKQEETFTVDLSGTKGGELLDENGNILATLSAEVCTLKIPAHTVRMIKFN